ncbi:MAG: hypothetical protein H7X79_07850 [Sporomusaceae bacterium]|nr:hypothetical protein [Sporomusaceae bacterium]
MKIISRQKIAALVAGTFIMAAAATPFIVQASDIQQPPAGQHQRHQKMSPEQAAQRLSAAFGIDQETIMKYNANGMSYQDIGKAAFLANASGKSIQDVVSLKTADNKWKDVAGTMGITKEQMQGARHDMVASRLNTKAGIDKQTTLDLLRQGYRSQDIGMAGQLAKNTNKPITEVLSLKKINNKWSDVANTLGVDKETFKKDAKAMGHGFGHKGHMGHKGPRASAK